MDPVDRDYPDEPFPKTPFITLLLLGKTVKKTENLMLDWVTYLERVGVDLLKYGTEEETIWSNQTSEHLSSFRWIRYFERWDRPGYYTEEVGPRLKGFNYGPRPEDWSLQWDMECEDFAGSFWDMVANPPLRIPGAWVDEDEGLAKRYPRWVDDPNQPSILVCGSPSDE